MNIIKNNFMFPSSVLAVYLNNVTMYITYNYYVSVWWCLYMHCKILYLVNGSTIVQCLSHTKSKITVRRGGMSAITINKITHVMHIKKYHFQELEVPLKFWIFACSSVLSCKDPHPNVHLWVDIRSLVPSSIAMITVWFSTI